MTAPVDLEAAESVQEIAASAYHPEQGSAALLLITIVPDLIAELRAARQDAARYRRIQNIAWGDGQGNWTFYMSDFVQSAAIAKGTP